MHTEKTKNYLYFSFLSSWFTTILYDCILYNCNNIYYRLYPILYKILVYRSHFYCIVGFFWSLTKNSNTCQQQTACHFCTNLVTRFLDWKCKHINSPNSKKNRAQIKCKSQTNYSTCVFELIKQISMVRILLNFPRCKQKTTNETFIANLAWHQTSNVWCLIWGQLENNVD